MDVPLDGTGADAEEPEPKAKRKPFRATQKALADMRGRGWTCGITERWNPHAMIRQDLFGFIDVIALCPGVVGVLAVQVTTSRTAEREQKITAEPRAMAWLRCGNAIEVWGYRKKCQGGRRGGRKVWTLVRRVASLDLGAPEPAIIWADAPNAAGP